MAGRDRRNIDYSFQLSDILAPQQGGGELLVAAGRSQGQASRIAGETNAAALTFLGTSAVGAYKGKLEAAMDAKMKDALDNLEGVGANALEIDRFSKGIGEQIVTLNEQSGGLDNEAGELGANFRQDIGRYVEAKRQGILNRDQVALRIATAVKEYSAMAPGWASDFRKQAQTAIDPSGMGSIDPTYAAMHAQSKRDKAAEAVAAAELALTKEYASDTGQTMEQAVRNPVGRELYRQGKMLKLQTENNERLLKNRDMGQAEADKAHTQNISLQVGQVVAGLGVDFAGFVAANGDLNNPATANAFGLQMAGKIARGKADLVAGVMAMTRAEPGRTALSVAEAQKQVAVYTKMFDDFEGSMKTVEGRNAFAGAVKNSNGNAEMLMNNLVVAHPHIAFLGKMGVMPPVFQAFTTMSEEEFSKRFPALKSIPGSLRELFKNPATLAPFGAVISGQPVDFEQLRRDNPDVAKVVSSNMVELVKEVGKKGRLAKPEEREAFVNVMQSLGTVSAAGNATLNLTAKQDVGALASILNDPAVQTYLTNLPAPMLAKALGPVATRVAVTLKNTAEATTAEVVKLNEGGKEVGWKYAIETDGFGVRRLTSKLDPTIYAKWVAKQQQLGVPLPTPYDVAATLPGGESSDARAAVRLVNSLLETRSVLDLTFDKGIAPHMPKVKEAVPRNTSAVEERFRRVGDVRDDRAAVEMRSREGSLSDVVELEAALKRKNLSAEHRGILERELKLAKAALQQ